MTDKSTKANLRADEEVRKNLPPGVKLIRTLRGHTGTINRIAWSPDGRMLASPSSDNTIRLWDAKTGKCLRKHESLANCVAFDPMGHLLASGSVEGSIMLWNMASGMLFRKLEMDLGNVWSVGFKPEGQILASGTNDGTVRLWNTNRGELISILDKKNKGFGIAFKPTGDILASGLNNTKIKLWDTVSGRLLNTLDGHQNYVNTVDFNQSGNMLVSAGDDKTIRLWDSDSGRLIRILETHTDKVNCAMFSADGKLIASKSMDSTTRLWNPTNGVCVATLSESCTNWVTGLAFHTKLPLLATVGSDPGSTKKDHVIHIYELDVDILFGRKVESSAHYVNAKVVLVGDTGVGKTGLSLVLNNQPFVATESTPGRRVWTFDSQEVEMDNKVTQTRETLLWDLAGQPGYRVIHQLHLKEVAVALVVFDARSETDPLAGVRHWERALRLARQREGDRCVPMMKFLVSARNDRGGVSVGEDRLKGILKEFDFDGFFKTSAKEGWDVKKLRAAIENAIKWEELPEVSSSQLFADIKSFLLDVKKKGLLLAQESRLYKDFAGKNPDIAKEVPDLQDQFETCVGRLEIRDLIRRLTFGGYVLLQPELLDAYASAMVNTAKEEPDGLGSLAEEIALAGKFFVPDEQKVRDVKQEQLLLHATVEELVNHDLALQESADDGRHLVFPSQFNRDYEDAPDPKGKVLAITFDGPVQSLYSTLAVRLGHSGLFTTGRVEMWRNAALFTAEAGGKCGIYLNEFKEARGRLIIFFPDDGATDETRFHFEEFILAHTRKRALEGTVELVRFFICPDCVLPVPDAYVNLLKEKGENVFNCPCGGMVSLIAPRERIHYESEVETMEKSANRKRDDDAFVMSAMGETSTEDFQVWAGGERVTLAIVFTDVVGSTAMEEEIKGAEMNIVRRAHFAQSRKLINEYNGREIKTIGDSFMTAFKSVHKALDYSIAFKEDTGHSKVKIRAGIHIGPMQIEEDDVFGGTVSFAARVIGAIDNDEIWVSDRAKDDIDQYGSSTHKQLVWERQENITMKGFKGEFTLWALRDSG
jgi:WD40 repeat protein/class 3 adenylate cyclase